MSAQGAAARLAAERVLAVERELRDDGVPVLVSAPRVCEILGVSARTLARIIADGELSTNRTRRAGAARTFVRRGELARYISAREHRETPARA